jgi:hypothetical protein
MNFSPARVIVRSDDEGNQVKREDKTILLKNLCPGWRQKELDALLKEKFGELGLKGKFRGDAANEDVLTRWTLYSFLKFDYQEDVDKIIERYGRDSVLKNPGSGLIFENCELLVVRATAKGKIKP